MVFWHSLKDLMHFLALSCHLVTLNRLPLVYIQRIHQLRMPSGVLVLLAAIENSTQFYSKVIKESEALT